MQRRSLACLLTALCLASAAMAQVKLEWKRPEGTSTLRTTTKTHQVLTLAGMAIETDAESASTSRLTTGKPAPDGTVRVEEKSEALSIRLSLPGVKVDYDSAKPDAKQDNPQVQAMVEGWRALSGGSFTYVLKDGKYVAVEGVEKILEKASPAAAASLQNELNPARLVREANEELGKIPDAPVKKGDRWMRTEVKNVGGGQTLTLETFYEYQGTVEKGGKTLDKIGIYTGTVKYAQDPNVPSPLKHVSSDLKVESSIGTLLFDREAGMLVESSSTIRITGPITFEANGMPLAGKVDLTMESASTARR